jgi:Trypsin
MLQRTLTLIISAALFQVSARAVIVSGTTGNITAPGDDPGWQNVGLCNSATAVYLGGGWVITAYHVNAFGSFPVSFTSGTYNVVGGTVHQLTNNGVGGMTANTDLVMFQINGDPGLPPLQVSASAPTLGMDLTMIGYGRNREAARTFWQVTVNGGPDTWTETAGPHNAEGYKAGIGQTKRWGTNDAEAVNVNVNDGVGDIRSMLSLFDDDALLTNEAQATVGDSGGGVFRKNGPNWELAGIMYAAGSLGNGFGFYDNLPAGASVYEHSATFTADLSFYRNQIVALMIPEPSASALLLLTAGFLSRRRR